MKKKYICPKMRAVILQAQQLMAFSKYDDEPATQDGLSNEDYGWDDEEDSSWGW